jgi:hypothetical protein
MGKKRNCVFSFQRNLDAVVYDLIAFDIWCDCLFLEAFLAGFEPRWPFDVTLKISGGIRTRVNFDVTLKISGGIRTRVNFDVTFFHLRRYVCRNHLQIELFNHIIAQSRGAIAQINLTR